MLDRLVNTVRAGESRVLVVRGDPGVGKTVLLDYLAERTRGCRIARATGVQSEMELAFAGLHQLCVSNSVLGNGLGRPRDAMAAAERAIAYHGDMGFSKWALVELVEAAVHSGMTETAAGAYRRLLAMTGPAGTDWALGLAARSRALLSDGDEAEGSYREAIDRLGRTRLRVELARAHLLYGEWLRRDNRRADARTQLRTAHEMLDAMGLAAFAERARRELAATGETARAHRRYGHRADRAGGLHRPAGLRRPHQRGGRAGRRDPRWLRRPVLPERSPTTDLRRAGRRPPLRVRRSLHLRRPCVPAVRRIARRDDDHVPVPRLGVRCHHRRRGQRSGRPAAQRVRRAGGRRRHPYPGMTHPARPRPPAGPAPDCPARCAARGGSRCRA